MQNKILCKECKRAYLEVVVNDDYYHDHIVQCPLCGFKFDIEMDHMGNLMFKMILFFMSCIFALVAIVLYVLFNQITISVVLFGSLAILNFIISLMRML